MFLIEKEDIQLLNDYCLANPEVSPYLADALLYCFKYHPEKYNELIEKYAGEIELTKIQN